MSTGCQTFSRRLRTATQAAHRQAENSAFIRCFLRGTSSRAAYLALLWNLRPAYEAMEESASTAAPQTLVGRFWDPQLARLAALDRDIAFLARECDPPRLDSSAADYASRIRASAGVEPHRLIGHLYTRYLGDLSGGFVLARIAARSLGLTREQGLSFYEFSGPKSADELKSDFRSALDSLDAESEDLRAAVIGEAIEAFRCNLAVFRGLEGDLFAGVWNLLLPRLRLRRRPPVGLFAPNDPKLLQRST